MTLPFYNLRNADPGVSMFRRIAFRLSCWVVRTTFRLCWRLRFEGLEHLPLTGPVLVIANHQSYLDPPGIGCVLRWRHFVPIARAGLFRVPVLGPMIRFYNSVPVKQGRGDLGAMKVALEQLSKGRMVLIFPEGSRSDDGAMKAFQRGAWLLIKRSHASVLPVGVDGFFDTWPRDRKWPPLRGRGAHVVVGAPIASDDLASMTPEAGLAELQGRVDALRLRARARLRERSKGRYPPEGPGDAAFGAGGSDGSADA